MTPQSIYHYRILNKIALSQKEYFPAFLISLIDVKLGRDEAALGWLEKAYQERSAMIVYIGIDPAFDPLRDNAHFKDIVRRAGLPPLRTGVPTAIYLDHQLPR